MKKSLIKKLNTILIITLLALFLFFQTFLIIEKNHQCDNDDCLICEVINSEGRKEKTSILTTSSIEITSNIIVFIPFILILKKLLNKKETLINLKVRLND